MCILVQKLYKLVKNRSNYILKEEKFSSGLKKQYYFYNIDVVRKCVLNYKK